MGRAGGCPSDRYDCRLGDLPMGSPEGRASKLGDRGRMRCWREEEVASGEAVAEPRLVAAATEAAALSWRCLCIRPNHRISKFSNASSGCLPVGSMHSCVAS